MLIETKTVIVRNNIEYFLGNNKRLCIAWFYLADLLGY